MAANLKNLIKLFFFIQKSNLKTAFLNKSDAFVNVLMMSINNLSFVFMWWIIFQNKGSINGWQFGQMALLFAIVNNAFGFFALCTRGVQLIPELIESGNLDNFLTTPQNSLFLIATSEATFANWGDFVTGFLMFFLSGYVSWQTFGIMLFCSFMAFILMFSVRLLASAMAFFVSDSQRLGDNIFISFLTFASQPASIFTGWYKVVFLTILPAGLLSFVPVNLVTNFSWSECLFFVL
ncbi:MAG: ABC-2 family transporter protein, partial [Alphaproteobacteria bacterium]|nr:ABC-2 family transporter protein [Alphaproteobacteria bacterium]